MAAEYGQNGSRIPSEQDMRDSPEELSICSYFPRSRQRRLHEGRHRVGPGRRLWYLRC
jgi:hypothetical protein